MANWYTSTHPTSLFTTSLMVQRLTPHGRTALLNTRLTERHRDGTAAERTLRTLDDLAEALETVFAITPPAAPVAIWSRLPKG